MKSNHLRSFFTLCLLLLAALVGDPAQGQTNHPRTMPFSEIKLRWDNKPVPEVIQAAEKGDVLAQHYLGRIYSDGERVSKNLDEALKWYRRAAEQGFLNSIHNIGIAYLEGIAVKADHQEAYKWLLRAAEENFALSQLYLGNLYFDGHGVEKNVNEAFRWYERAADQGELESLANLAWRSIHGHGVETNRQKAIKLLQKGVEQGHPRSHYLMGIALGAGKGLDPFNPESIRHLEASADKGFVLAQVELGRRYDRDQNYQLAAEWYRKAAEAGDAEGQYRLADLYNYGKLGDEHRPLGRELYRKAGRQGHTQAMAQYGEMAKDAEGFEMLRTAAERGVSSAQWFVSRAYSEGNRVEKNDAEAFKWMLRLAQGNEDRSSLINHAQYEVARMYEHGIGVPQNKKLARQIYLQIAEYSGAARYKVATMYEQGDGVPKDLKKAAEYYANAYSSGWVKGTGSRVVAQIGLYAIDPAACKDPVDFAQQLRAEESGVTLPQTQRQLGQIYYDGKPLAQDFAKASEWFTKAALQNDPIAQYRLGQMWASGTHGPPNMEEAVLWYLKAARQGLADAQYKLGSAYFEGSGVSKDLIAAFVWLSAAAQNGFANAEELLADLRATMSAEEVEKAKQHPFLRNVK